MTKEDKSEEQLDGGSVKGAGEGLMCTNLESGREEECMLEEQL